MSLYTSLDCLLQLAKILTNWLSPNYWCNKLVTIKTLKLDIKAYTFKLFGVTWKAQFSPAKMSQRKWRHTKAGKNCLRHALTSRRSWNKQSKENDNINLILGEKSSIHAFYIIKSSQKKKTLGCPQQHRQPALVNR